MQDVKRRREVQGVGWRRKIQSVWVEVRKEIQGVGLWGLGERYRDMGRDTECVWDGGWGGGGGIHRV